MEHQQQPSKVESVILSALDPKSTAVYYLANVSIIALIITLIVLYFVLQSYHLLVMCVLALGLLGSVNFVWMHRVDPDQADTSKEENDNDAKATDSMQSRNATQSVASPRRKKKKRKE
mmetsp:Transcript_37442/g.59967  ORF Transcript_37442/g.59967 Transcript_37442/m.59967 type:complete len:118 (-) Transcript_37442:209-562(-)